MPKRNNLVRHPSEELQGDGSYVLLRNITWGEMKRRGWLTGERTEGKDRKIDEAEKIFEFCVADWNWVDDEDNPLPLPKDDPAVLDKLTYAESTFIMEKLFGSKVEVVKKKRH